MEKKLILIHNKEMETLDIWFDDPEKEHVCEEVGDGIILKKDRDGKVLAKTFLLSLKPLQN